MSFISKFLGLNFYPKSFKQDSPPPTLHSSINWTNSIVAGSYALQQFTGDTHWKCSDIDVMVACLTKDEFDREANRFQHLSNMRLNKENWFDDPNRDITNKSDELFHERVLGSKTYSYDGYDKTVQLVCLKQAYPNEHPIQILNETSDIPACVSYSVLNDGSRVFHIPEKGREIIMTRNGDKTMICPSRLDKYTARGYFFN
jgi:hypothetical protein